jgi:RES domain-containing protein
VLTAWRIVKAKHAAAAFDGEGARVLGGRWNTPGTRMVYTSSTAALAALEMLVHLNRALTLPAYVLIRCTFEKSLVTALDIARLPRDWRSYPAPPQLQTLGDQWAKQGDSAVLRVPSVIVDKEINYLLNPAHRDFHRIRIHAAESFSFDLRLVTA